MIFFVFLGIIVICFLVHLFTKPFEHESKFCEFIAGLSFVFIVLTIAISVIWILLGARHNTETYVLLKRKKTEAKMAISFARSETLRSYSCSNVVDAYQAVSEYNRYLAKCMGLEESFLWGWAMPSDELRKYKFIDIDKALDELKCQIDLHH